MNEPSVFSGPEITMPKDNLHHGGVEHRDIHNQYGFYMTKATREGHLTARPDQRPFILSRSFFAGSQRDVAVWTGDNMAKWEHLYAAQPMLLTLSLSGIVFCGADVGGFFYNPEPELLVRWYQAAAYHPFFRGHAHIDTKRREPWLFGPENTALIRSAIRARYAILPYVYTLFYQAHADGIPVMRPLFMEYPKDEETFAMEDQFLLGSDLLVKPVTKKFEATTKVYLPGSEPWYDDETGAAVEKTGWTEVACPMHKIPVFQRGGSIVPKRLRPRRSSGLMRHDPYTIVVALSKEQEAVGRIYVDDGDGYAFQTGQMVYRELVFKQSVLSSRSIAGQLNLATQVERVIVLGLHKSPSKVSADGRELGWVFDEQHKKLTIRKPAVQMGKDWSIQLD
jgi:alpha 1,3-glucosidase